jgi:hypothetical protein
MAARMWKAVHQPRLLRLPIQGTQNARCIAVSLISVVNLSLVTVLINERRLIPEHDCQNSGPRLEVFHPRMESKVNTYMEHALKSIN